MKATLHFRNNKHLLKVIFVTAKIISNASKEFITSVTICNNKQNPVEPWNLRASDSIQLAFQDKFRDDLGIFYERQENSFESHTDEDLEEMGIKQYKAVEIKRLAQTFLAFQGEVDKMSRLREVFETDSIYQNTFQKKYINEGKSRKILLIYKIQFRLNKVIKEIINKGHEKYYFISKGRNLIWALLINEILCDNNIESLCERFGTSLNIEADFSD